MSDEKKDPKADDTATKHDDGTGRSTEVAVGLAEKPKNIPIPEEAIIRRPKQEENGQTVQSPTVTGDQSLIVMDVLQGTALQDIIVLQGSHLNPDDDGTVVFIQGTVSNDIVSAKKAKSLFALKPDGTVIYNSRGFDDVSPKAEFDLVDIVKLVELNSKRGQAKKDD